MVRGNWEKRVETAHARKEENKQRKSRKEERETARERAASFLATIGGLRLGEQRRESVDLHVWTDGRRRPRRIPEDRYRAHGDDDDDDDGDHDKRAKSSNRPRSSSDHHHKERSSSSRRPGGGGGGAKKAHPRSHQAPARSTDDARENGVAPLRMCRDHFFHGDGGGGGGGGENSSGGNHKKGKKGSSFASSSSSSSSSSLVRFAKDPCWSLHDVCRPTRNDDRETKTIKRELLRRSYDASKRGNNDGDGGDDDDGNGAAVCWHVVVPSSSAASALTTEEKISLSDVAYVAANGWLLYDRALGGALHDSDTLRERITGAASSPSSLCSNRSKDKEHVRPLRDEPLPASVLEHVLTFLPDEATGVLPRVCRDWRREIGTQSPFLWRHLSRRRGWPGPPRDDDDDDDVAAATDAHRRAYVACYSVVRDAKVLRAHVGGGDEATHGSPSSSHRCHVRTDRVDHGAFVAVRLLSPARALVAQRRDGTLRTYDVSSSSSSRVRESAQARVVAPKGGCRTLVEDVDVDDRYVVCLWGRRPHDETDQQRRDTRSSGSTRKCFLTVVTRDDLLGGELEGSWTRAGAEDTSRRVVNLREQFLNYIRRNEANARAGDENFEAETNNDAFDHLEVRVSNTVVAGGGGKVHFLVDLTTPGEFVDGVLCTYSYDRDEIVSATDLNRFFPVNVDDLDELAADGDDDDGRLVLTASPSKGLLVISSRRAPGRVLCVRPSGSTENFVCAVHRVGDGELPAFSDEEPPHRSVVVVSPSDDVVVVGTVRRAVRDPPGSGWSWDSFLTFYRTTTTKADDDDDDDDKDATFTLPLARNVELVRLSTVGRDFLLALCRARGGRDDDRDDDGDDDDGEFDGHWFGPDENAPAPVRLPEPVVEAVLVHVPSRTVFERVELGRETAIFPHPSYDSPNRVGRHDLPLLVAADDTTAAAAVSWRGVVLTGTAVRDEMRRASESSATATDAATPSPSHKKKKKGQRRTPKGGKKDGFARGMSLRG